MISTVSDTPHSYNDPWVIPHPSNIESYGDTMPLSPIELAYSMIQSIGESYDSHSRLLLDEEIDRFSSPYWDTHTSTSHEFLNIVLPSKDSIMEFMNLQDKPWEDSHHRSSLFPFGENKETQMQTLTSTDIQYPSLLPSTSYPILFEGNLGNISKTISIDISVKPGVMENIHIGAHCSPE
jgi:hypothetical protein